MVLKNERTGIVVHYDGGSVRGIDPAALIADPDAHCPWRGYPYVAEDGSPRRLVAYKSVTAAIAGMGGLASRYTIHDACVGLGGYDTIDECDAMLDCLTRGGMIAADPGCGYIDDPMFGRRPADTTTYRNATS
jgi:hypothetical protein